MPDTPRILHGTLGLAPDPRSPIGLRFVGIGEDPAPASVTLPSELPDAALLLRAFGDARERDGYVAALSETGGNTFSWIEGPAHGRLPPLLLVARWDRPRHPGETLEEAIPLVGAAGAGAAYAVEHDRAGRDAALRTERARVRASWSGETRILSSDPGIMLTDEDAGGVRFVSTRTGAACELTRGPEGHRVSFSLRYGNPAPDTPGWREAAAAAGCGIDASGRISAGVPALAAGWAERLDATVSRLSVAAQALGDLSRAEGIVDRILADANAMRALACAVRGNPILQSNPGSPLLQASLRPGASRRVSGTALGELERAGLVEPVLTPPGNGAWLRCPVVWVATALGAALAEGDRAAVVRGVSERPRVPERWQPARGIGHADGDPADVLAGIGARLAPADLSRLAGVAGAAGLDGTVLPAGSDAERWLAPIAGMVSGAFRPGPGGRLEAVDPAADGPGLPRP
jgi:hypothetical protein